MPRQPAIRIKMSLALKADISNMPEFAKTIKTHEKLRAYAKELGYIETADFSSIVGSYDFGGKVVDPATGDE